MEKFEVEYLKHSLFKPAESHREIVDKPGLIDLLYNGMVSVFKVRRVIL